LLRHAELQGPRPVLKDMDGLWITWPVKYLTTMTPKHDPIPGKERDAATE